MMMRVILWAAAACVVQGVAAGEFNVSNDQFVRDGEVFQVLSCSLHYPRLSPAYWDDVLLRLRAMGCNAIQTYVPWNFHEQEEGVFDFTGPKDFGAFVKHVQQAGMILLLRCGPYICGEWDFGGLPAWLLWKNATLRTYEETYIRYVDRFLTKVHEIARPLLYSNGGPIVMIQMENEYGSYGNVQNNPKDKQYMEHLVNLTTKNMQGSPVLLYTTDPPSAMARGTLPGGSVISLGDHGPGNFDPSCQTQAHFNPAGRNPCMDTEFYTGWITAYGQAIANTSTQNVVDSLETAMGKGYSVNLYMGFGGTNFAFMSGANGGGDNYIPTITSYDYDSAVGENADHGYGSDGKDKYVGIQSVFKKYNKVPLPTEPPARHREQYPDVRLTRRAALLDPATLGVVGTHASSSAFKTMDEMGQANGLILYTTTSSVSGNTISISSYPSDRASILVDKEWKGTFYRPNYSPLTGVGVKAGSRIDILVENMGRINFGHGMQTEVKGIRSDTKMSVGSQNLAGFDIYSIPLNNTDQFPSLPWQPLTCNGVPAGPAFYEGTLTIDGTPTDTYVSTRNFSKGYVWVNGHGLGRYWEIEGPQHALYVPAPYLKQGSNSVVFFEFESVSPTCTAKMTTDFDFKGRSAPKCRQPSPGTVATLYSCDVPDFQGWKVNNISQGFSLSLGDLCLAATNDDTPYAVLKSCNSADKSQLFSSNGQKIVSAAFGTCLDVEGEKKNPGSKADWTTCKGSAGQTWTMAETPGHVIHVTNKLNQFCLSACKL